MALGGAVFWLISETPGGGPQNTRPVFDASGKAARTGDQLGFYAAMTAFRHEEAKAALTCRRRRQAWQEALGL